jgi:mono/diheme cytochrome c family protein
MLPIPAQVFVAGFAFTVLTAFAALAQTVNPADGRRLALSVCANCHVVPESRRESAMDAAPTFAAIANDPAMTDERLRHFLNQPHSQMPPIVIAREEIEDVIAYLRTIRRTPAKGRN